MGSELIWFAGAAIILALGLIALGVVLMAHQNKTKKAFDVIDERLRLFKKVAEEDNRITNELVMSHWNQTKDRLDGVERSVLVPKTQVLSKRWSESRDELQGKPVRGAKKEAPNS